MEGLRFLLGSEKKAVVNATKSPHEQGARVPRGQEGLHHPAIGLLGAVAAWADGQIDTVALLASARASPTGSRRLSSKQ